MSKVIIIVLALYNFLIIEVQYITKMLKYKKVNDSDVYIYLSSINRKTSKNNFISPHSIKSLLTN